MSTVRGAYDASQFVVHDHGQTLTADSDGFGTIAHAVASWLDWDHRPFFASRCKLVHPHACIGEYEVSADRKETKDMAASTRTAHLCLSQPLRQMH